MMLNVATEAYTMCLHRWSNGVW